MKVLCAAITSSRSDFGAPGRIRPNLTGCGPRAFAGWTMDEVLERGLGAVVDEAIAYATAQAPRVYPDNRYRCARSGLRALEPAPRSRAV